jgi:hypothetical protein
MFGFCQCLGIKSYCANVPAYLACNWCKHSCIQQGPCLDQQYTLQQDLTVCAVLKIQIRYFEINVNGGEDLY